MGGVANLIDVEETSARDVRFEKLSTCVSPAVRHERTAIDDGEIRGAKLSGKPVRRHKVVHCALRIGVIARGC
jgi:hypothetical protein